MLLFMFRKIAAFLTDPSLIHRSCSLLESSRFIAGSMINTFFVSAHELPASSRSAAAGDLKKKLIAKRLLRKKNTFAEIAQLPWCSAFVDVIGVLGQKTSYGFYTELCLRLLFVCLL